MQISFSTRNCLSISLPLALICILQFGFTSCINTRKLTYMQGSFDTARLSQIQLSDPCIQKGDLISIIVYSDNPQATAIYNQSLITVATGAGGGAASEPGGAAMSGGALSSPGYLVDETGNIEFQELGTLHVEGLTRTALKDTLTARLKEYLKNPYFNIRFLNYKFSMLGELTRPGTYTIPGEHINILEALGLAGDITVYGRRDNVLVIREVNGKREWGRLDLTKPEVMASPYFYLQQNDVVIVDPNKSKAASGDLTVRNISIAATVVTTLAVIISLLRL